MNTEPCKTKLLSDDPALEDAFGSHSRLASAIAGLVSSDTGGRAVALTGSWGSGKSTTISLIRKELEAEEKIFVFNAWAHQGDPLRRTFLEQLIDYLSECDWLSNSQYWDNAKKELANRRKTEKTRSTPLLTRHGKALALALIATPLGLAMFASIAVLSNTNLTNGSSSLVPWWFPWLGLVIASAPLLYIILLFVAYGVCWFLRYGHEKSRLGWRWVNWLTNWTVRPLNASEVLLNKATTTTTSSTIETTDPTSVEFKRHFDKLVGEALQKEKRKLVIVIDNLDRVDTEQALSLWATMNAFFDFRVAADCQWLTKLWLIVPFDSSALNRLWPDRNNKAANEQPNIDAASWNSRADLAQVFTQKTFAITFHVPLPVRSDWHNYLLKQLKDALPDHNENDFHTVYRIYRLGALSQDFVPTPRDVKMFVNQIGAVHRQWHDEIPLPLQALYVTLYKPGWNIRQQLSLPDNEVLGKIPVELVGDQWRDSLAAIHFNARDKALQIILGQKIESALTAGDSKTITELREIPGVHQIIEDLVDENWQDWSKGETSSIAQVALALGDPSSITSPSLTRAWNLLCNAVTKISGGILINDEIGGGLAKLAQYKKDPSFVKSLVSILAKSTIGETKKGEEPDAEKIDQWLRGVALVLKESEAIEGADASSSFSVPGDAKQYIRLIGRLVKADALADLIQYFKPQTQPASVIQELSKVCSEGTFKPEHADVVGGLRKVNASFDWAKLIESARARLADPAVEAEEAKALLLVLYEMSATEKSAANALSSLSTQGHIFHLLYKFSSPEDVQGEALCLLPILQHVPSGSPGTSPDNASDGVNVYSAITGNPSAKEPIAKEVAVLAKKYDLVERLFEASADANSGAAFAKRAIATIAVSPNANQFLLPEQIVTNYGLLENSLEDGQLSHLLELSAEHSELTKAVVGHGFQVTLVTLYLALYQHVKETNYVDFLIEGLKHVDKNTWLEALSEETSLLRLLIALVDNSHKPDLEVVFVDALTEHADKLIKGQAKVERLADDWTKLSQALGEPLRESFYYHLIQILCREDKKATDPLISCYGAELSKSSALEKEMTDLVRDAGRLFLSRNSPQEIKWLAQALKQHRDAFLEVDEPIKAEFESRMKTSYQDQKESELGQELQSIASEFGISLERVEESENKDEAEGKAEEGKVEE